MPAPEIAVAYVSIVPEIEGFARQLRQQIVAPAGDAGEDAGEAAGKGLSGALKAGALAAGLAAGAVMAQGLADAFEQAGVTKRLQAQLGATSKDADRYGKVAGKLFSKGITENFEAGAEAIRAVVNGGLVKPDATNKQLESIATKMSDVATTFGTDMNMQSQAVSAMLKNGLAPSAEAALDVIAKGMQSLGPNAEDLLETFQEYSVQMSKLGVDSTLALGLFQQGLKGGARDTDILADALKEFSIRSIDMSTTSRQAYKDLGLSAKDMESQIGKGGKDAVAGLDTVLDSLRNMHDPVAREAAAVGLFGTQAEDLGKALFELDPSTATKGLVDLEGSASKLGETVRQGPAYELKVFARTAQQALTDAMTKYAIPAITGAIDIAQSLGASIRDNWGVFKEVAAWLSPVIVAVAGLTLALNANAIATALVTGVLSLYRAALLLGTAVTGGMSVATGILNAVMALNPFVLIAIAIAAFIAVLVVAYNKVGWFRDICDVAFKAIGDTISWLWKNIIEPVFNFIGELAMWLYTLLAVIVLAPLILLFKAVGAVLGWLWDKVFEPVFGWIGEKAMWLWNNAIKPSLRLIKDDLKALGGKLKELWDKYAKPVLNFIGEKGKWLWDKALKPAFDAMKIGIGKVGDSFKDAKNFIGRQWSALQDIAKGPVKFLINTVYNAGIVPLWNKVAGAVGGKKLSKVALPKGFARGGVLPGSSSWRDGDDQLVPMRKGEGVYVSEAMRDPYERARLFAVNNAAMRGKSLSQFRDTQGPQGFAKGGILGSIGSALKAPWDWAKDSVGGFLKGRFNSLLDGFPGLNSGFGQLVKGVPVSFFKNLIGYGEKKAKDYSGGPGVKNALNFARSQAGKPYQWAGGGNPSWDCSGFMAGIQKAILGQNPNGRLWSTHAFSGDQAPAGWVRGMKAPFTIGITNAGVGHTAGTLGGVNVESRGGDGVVVGPRARGASSSLFTDVYGFAPSRKYDDGGWLQPGATMSVNASGKPEPILTSSQWASVATLANRGMEGAPAGLQAGDTLLLSVDGRTTFEAYVDKRADVRIDRTLTRPASLGRNR